MWWGGVCVSKTGVHLFNCFDICHTSLNKQMLKCSSNTIENILLFCPENISHPRNILYWQFYKNDVNVLKFLAYLIQFNLIKPNCPLKCKVWEESGGPALICRSTFPLCLRNIENKDFYLHILPLNSSAELFQQRYKCFLFQLSIFGGIFLVHLY